jgi:hypothetical protein
MNTTTPQKETPAGSCNSTAGHTKRNRQILPRKTPPEKRDVLLEILDASPGNSGAAQRERILMALARFGLNTDEIRRYLDCYDARKRVSELRQAGYAITTHWQTIITEAGERHRVGLYILNTAGGTS